MNNPPEKKRQERKLKKLLVEALESGPATPLTKADFVEIKSRGTARLKVEKAGQTRI